VLTFVEPDSQLNCTETLLSLSFSLRQASMPRGLSFFVYLAYSASCRHSPFPNMASTSGAIAMAQALDPKEIVEFRELIITNTIQVDTMYQL